MHHLTTYRTQDWPIAPVTARRQPGWAARGIRRLGTRRPTTGRDLQEDPS